MPVTLFEGTDLTLEEKRALRDDFRADLRSGAIDEAEYIVLCEQNGLAASGRIEENEF